MLLPLFAKSKLLSNWKKSKSSP